MTLKERLPGPVRAALHFANKQRPVARRDRRGLHERLQLGALIFERTGGVVQRGPFAGLRFARPTPDTPAKCIGTYEVELYPAIERLVSRDFDRVLNIGSAEGFFAVGLALRLPRARVWAFDIAPGYQQACRELAAANGLADRIEVGAECGHAELQRLAAGALVVIDCEGCEDYLLDPKAVPSLIEATVLVELHDVFDDALPRRILERFRVSHDMKLIESRPRGQADADVPELEGLLPEDRLLAVFERPIRQTWAVLTPRD